MKVKVLCRNPDDFLRETKRDIFKVPRNFDPTQHPFEAAREYKRALNAIKLERVFAKPFVGNMDGHKEGVSCMIKHPKRLTLAVSGAYDGEVIMWNVHTRSCVRRFKAHTGFVRDLTFVPDGNRFISIGDDKTIKMWNTDSLVETDAVPTETFISKTDLSAISHHQNQDLYATGGDVCLLWEESRNTPIKEFKWGCDTLNDVAFNPIETNMLAACAADRSIILYDTRGAGNVRKITMKMVTNKICWNPMEAYIFTCANEDYNLHTFDMRHMKEVLCVHKDHTSAVTCLDYSPTGKEFVSGCYDKTIRIFQVGKIRSREIYHTKRMQRVTCIAWTADDKYILNGSTEMNVRIWKAHAAEKLGVVSPRERNYLEYCEALKEKYAAHPQISRIARHRHVPHHILLARKELQAINRSIRRKEVNKRKHSKPGSVPKIPERQKHVIQEDE